MLKVGLHRINGARGIGKMDLRDNCIENKKEKVCPDGLPGDSKVCVVFFFDICNYNDKIILYNKDIVIN